MEIRRSGREFLVSLFQPRRTLVLDGVKKCVSNKSLQIISVQPNLTLWSLHFKTTKVYWQIPSNLLTRETYYVSGPIWFVPSRPWHTGRKPFSSDSLVFETLETLESLLPHICPLAQLITYCLSPNLVPGEICPNMNWDDCSFYWLDPPTHRCQWILEQQISMAVDKHLVRESPEASFQSWNCSPSMSVRFKIW